MSVAEWSLLVIAIVYAGFALGGIIAFFVGLKMYKDLKKSVDELKKEIEPYRSKVDDLVYKAQQIMDVANEIMLDLKTASKKTTETVGSIVDKTAKTADELLGFVVTTKKRADVHTAYLFERVEKIEERLDNVYAVLKGAGVLVSKLKTSKED